MYIIKIRNSISIKFFGGFQKKKKKCGGSLGIAIYSLNNFTVYMIWNQSFLSPTISQRRIGLSERGNWDGWRNKQNQNKLNSKKRERREKQANQEDSTMVETMAVESGPIKVMIYADGCSRIRMRKFAETSFLDGPKVGHSCSLFGMEDVGLEWIL